MSISIEQERLRALLEERAEAALTQAAETIPRRDETGPSSLSAAQSRLWFLAQYEQESAVYNVPVALRLQGSLDEAALLAAVRDVAERHEVLRSAIRLVDGEPLSVPLPAADVPVRAAATSDEQLDAELRAEASRAFALDAEPPMRAVLFRLADDDHVLALTFHHVAFDDWSYDLLLRDLDACYAARLGAVTPAAPALQYGDVAAWERSSVVDPAGLAWWRERLAGLARVLDLPVDRRRPTVADWTAGQVPLKIPASLAERLRERARETGCTPSMVLLAGWQSLLGRLAGVDDVAVGVPEAGRHHPETEGVIGCFVNTVVARTDLSGDPSGRELLGRVRDVVLDAFAHAAVPFDAVVQELAPKRNLAGAPLVQALLNVLENAGPRPDLAGLRVMSIEPSALTTQFDVRLSLRREAEGYEGSLVYRADLFQPETAQRWARWYVALLDGMLADLDRPVSRVEILDAAERSALIAAGTGQDLPAGRPPTVVDAVLARARQRPGAVATQDPLGSLTYAELAEWAHRAAAAIRAARGDDEVVGVCLPRDRYLPAALLAVLQSGAAYLPLEPDHPEAHLGRIASGAGVRLVVARGSALERARAIPGVTVVDLDRVEAAESTPLPEVPGDDLAYLLYTSGSTGKPKGVEITHANLAGFVAAMADRPGVGPRDTVLALAPLTFDASTLEIWTTLAAGGRCHVVERDAAVDGRLLAERIAAGGVTAMCVPPTTLRMLLAAGWSGDPQLRVWSGGEALDSGLASDLVGRVGELWNLYGPTEATIASAAHKVTAVEGDTAPIGTPMAGESLYVVDRDGRLAPPGVTGELWIGGCGVARGYRGARDLTAAAFVPDPFRPAGRCYRTGDHVRWRSEGVLEFVGRRDRQVKVRGYRIELGGIEAALLGRPEVSNAAVLVHGQEAGVHLVAYVEPASIDAEALQAELARSLPSYMVPRRWVVLERLPLLTSGKVDRHALPAPGDEPDARPHLEPSTEAELLLAEVWQAILEVPAVGAQDDFFALGGHSLAATRVAGRLTEGLGLRVPVRVLFDRPVLADLAVELERLVLAELEVAEVVA